MDTTMTAFQFSLAVGIIGIIVLTLNFIILMLGKKGEDDKKKDELDKLWDRLLSTESKLNMTDELIGRIERLEKRIDKLNSAYVEQFSAISRDLRMFEDNDKALNIAIENLRSLMETGRKIREAEIYKIGERIEVLENRRYEIVSCENC